ncbi:unnamed protein product [Cylicocyclus nassatus]|uniref:Uncharacterized protein n=1 Tax=Cylicocyclus nassatus TaxID=53992 RepID=A0AA36DUR5_CYLNA|nr:unnamed protein product [Cylicocyclus nassatus]
MDKKDEESDEDEAFLHSSMEILDGIYRGDEVTELTEHLRKPENSFDSDATDCIYRAIKTMARQTQNNSLGSLCSSPVRSPVPDKVNESPENDLDRDNLATGDHRMENELSFSPTSQVGDIGDRSQNELETIVPRLTLEFSPTTSVNHTPLPSPHSQLLPVDTPRLRTSIDFVYLFLFGLGTALIFYYFYLPPLYKGPVY